MAINRRDLAQAAIYTGFYLGRFIQRAVPEEISDKIYDLIIDNLNVMGAVVDLDELQHLDDVEKERALAIARNTKSKVLAAIVRSCGPQIGDWFELVFSVSLLETRPEALQGFKEHLHTLATHVGFPQSDFTKIMEDFEASNRGEPLKEFINTSLAIVSLPYVFVSYATSDREIAEEFADLFRARNVKAFVANIDILPGSEWHEELKEELYKADELLLILSPKSITSNWVMIEVGAAWALGKRITPALIYCDLESAPEPIKRFQAKNITTTAARHELVEAITKRVHGD